MTRLSTIGVQRSLTGRFFATINDMAIIDAKEPKYDIGARIRHLREEAGLSLRGLAELCGLSFNAISRIEHGENSPTVATLHRLASALNVPITDFFTPNQAQITLFTKAGSGLSTQLEGVTIESLAGRFANQQLEAFRLLIAPNSDTRHTAVVHSGEELVFCLHGCITYYISQQPYTMEAGDALFFRATQPHCWHNAGPETAVVLVVFQTQPEMPLLWQQHTL